MSKESSVGKESERYNKGLEIRRAVLGSEYVNRSIDKSDDFTRPLQRFITEVCWGDVWGREGLSHKHRSMLNIAMLTALNRPNELRLHLKGAINNGVTKEEIREILMQALVYCGIPAGLDAFKVASEVLKEESADKTSSHTRPEPTPI